MAISSSRALVKNTHIVNIADFINDVDGGGVTSKLGINGIDKDIDINIDSVMDILKDNLGFLKDIDASSLKRVEGIMSKLIANDVLIKGLNPKLKKDILKDLANTCTNLHGIEGLSFKLPSIDLYGLLALLLALLCNGITSVFNTISEIVGESLTSEVVSRLVPGMIKNNDGKNSFAIVGDLADSKFGEFLHLNDNNLGIKLDSFLDKDTSSTMQPSKKFDDGVYALGKVSPDFISHSKNLKQLANNKVKRDKPKGFNNPPPVTSKALGFLIR